MTDAPIHKLEANRGHRRQWLIALGICLGLVLIGGVWLGATGYMVAREARTLSTSLGDLESSVSSVNITQTAQSLPVARDSAHRYMELTSAPPWRLVERLPKVGAQLTASREVVGAVDDLLQASAPLQPVLDAVAQGRLRTFEGSVNLDLITGSVKGLRDTAAAIPSAVALLSQADTSLLPAQVGHAVSSATTQLPTLVPTLNAAADSAERIGPLLGADGPRTWLVLLQNPSEARGTGGFIGGYALITADHGKLTLTHAGPNDELVKHQPVNYSGLPQETQDLWGRDLAEWSSINLSPHFPYTGQLAVQGLKQMGESVDGVIAVDPQVVAWILQATGPATVDGHTITAANAADYVTRQVYVDYPDSAAKDAALLSLLEQSLQHLTSGSVDLKKLSSGIAPLVSGHHLQAFSTVAAEQAWLESIPLGGTIDEAPGPHVTIALNNGAGNKVDAYINTSAEYAAGACAPSPSQISNVTLTLRNRAPKTGLPEIVTVRNDNPQATRAGERMLVAVYGPADGQLLQASLNGKPVLVSVGSDRGHPVWSAVMEVDPGQISKLTLKFLEPTVANTAPSLQLPPMVNPPKIRVTTVGCQP